MDDAACFGDDIALLCEDCKGFVFNHQTGSYQNGLNIFNNQQDREHPNGVMDPYSIQFTIVPRNRTTQSKKVSNAISPDQGNDNESEIERHRGKKLHYGQIIQLQHKFTKNFVHVSKTETSRQDKNNMRVFLSARNTKEAQFKIIPKFKVKDEGDVVQINEEVVFESIKTPGQYLHASKSWSMSSLLIASELNLGVSPSGFTLRRTRRAGSMDPGTVLMAGSMIRLLHKETNAYLVASGVVNSEPTEDVHMRGRKAKASPSSSAISYWTVEAEESMTYGDVLSWKQHVRLRHMTTLRYLMVLPSGKLGLTADSTDALTVFRLHPVVETRKEVELETYTWIQHVISETWIHAGSGVYLRKELQEHVERPKSMRENLRWDTATLISAESVKGRNYDDAFTIQHVNSELDSFYRFAVGMVPGIQDLVLNSQNAIPSSTLDLKVEIKAMEELIKWMDDKGSASKKRQKLLRDLGIVDLIVSFLMQEHRATDNKTELNNLQAQFYKVLEKFLEGDVRKNELYVCKYMEFFTKQFNLENELGRRATEMMTELIKDNRKVIDRISQDEICYFIDLIKRRKNYRFLSLLGELCVCDGVALPENQKFVADKWLAEDKVNIKDPLLRTADRTRGHDVTLKGMKQAVLLTEVGSNIDSSMDANTVYVSKDGVNWIPIHDYCGPADEDGLHYSDDYLFLERQLDLFSKLCTGRNNHCIEMISRKLKYLTWEEALMCLKDDRLPDALRAKYCNLITGMFVDVGENRSVLDQLQLTFIYKNVCSKKEGILGRNGPPPANEEKFPELRDWLNNFFDQNKDMTARARGKNKLIEQVLRLLYNLVAYGYYKGIDDIRTLLRPLLSLLDGRNDKPDFDKTADEKLQAYRETERFKKSPANMDVVSAKHMAMEVVDLLMSIESKVRLERFLGLYKPGERSTGKLRLSKLESLMSETAFFKEKEIDILMDLTNYNYSKMVVKSLGLMNKYYSAYHNLFTEAVQAQVLTTSDSMEVHRYLDWCLPQLRRLLTTQIPSDQVSHVCEILAGLTQWCHLPDEPDEPHTINQNILVNNGILTIIFNLLQQKLDTELTNQYSGYQTVLRSILLLLKFLIKDNKQVQTLAFDNFNFLIEIQGMEKELGEALLEIFTGNQETCLQVTSQQIQAVMQRIAYLKEDASEFLDLLCAIVKVEELDEPLKRNQTQVMRSLMKNYHEVARVLEKPLQYRQGILRSGDSRPAELSYLISLIDLLASCAEGENQYIESLCQNLLPLNEVIDMLNDDSIDNNLKRPYLRFLLWAYLRTGVTGLDTGVSDLPNRIIPWKRGFLRHLKKVLAWLKGHEDDARRLLKKAPPKSYVSDSEDDQMFATLHFIFDAAFPFLKEYYDEKACKHTTPEQLRINEYLAEALMEFTDTVAPLISSEIQMGNMRQAVIALLNRTDRNIRTQEKTAFADRQETANTLEAVLSEAREKYVDFYREELKLNSQVNDFARSMETLYMKENKASLQLHGIKNNRKYCEETDALRLPLGNEFQQMVKKFMIDHKQTKCHRVEKLVQQLHISCTKLKPKEQGSTQQVALDIKCLQLMRALIHNQERHLPSNTEKHNNPKYDQYLDEISAIQKVLNEYDAIVKTLPLMSRTQRGLTGQYLSFLTAMFFNADITSQEAMGIYFRGTRDELFFYTCSGLFQNSMTSVKERRMLLAKHKSKQDDANKRFASLRASLSERKFKMNSLNEEIQRQQKEVKKEEYMSEPVLNYFPKLLTESQWKKEMVNVIFTRAEGSSSIISDFPFVLIATVAAVGATVGFSSLEKTIRNPTGSPIKDDYNIELLLQMLASMCDGQNKDLQDYLREQPDNIKTTNLVGKVVDYLKLFYSHLDIDNIKLVTQLFSTLNEFCSGNIENSQVVVDHDLIDYLNVILQDTKLQMEIPEDKLVKLYQIIGFLIMSMIEEDHPSVTKLTKELRNTIDVASIRKIAVHYHKQNVNRMPQDKQLRKSTRDTMLNVGFKYHFIIQRLNDILPIAVDDDKDLSDSMKYYDNHSMSVEVMTDNGLQRCRFRVKDKNVLREEVKEQLKWSIDRSSPSNKLRDLFDWSSDILDDIKYQRSIRENKLIDFIIHRWTWWNYLVIFLSLIINIVMIVTWDSQGALGKTEITSNSSLPESIYSPIPLTPNWYNSFLLPAGILHNILSLLVAASFVLANRPTLPTMDRFRFRRKKGEENQPKLEMKRQSHLRPKFLSFVTIYYVALVVFSLCGTAFYGYFFAFHLLNIVFDNNILQRVIRAVTLNGRSLLWVGVLGLFTLYIFTLVAFGLMRASLDPAGEQTLFCITLWQCLVTIIRFGLLGELFEFMRPHELGLSFRTFGLAAIFHVSFFIIITTVGLNIIFGIILDTFSELRESKRDAENDMRSRCFICNRNSFEFEKQAQGFEHHVKNDHNMWAYMFLRICLEQTAERDFTNIEKQVYSAMKAQKTTFFPIGQALCLANAEDDGTQAQLSEILLKLNSLTAKQEAQEQEKKQMEEAARQENWEKMHRDETAQRAEEEKPQTYVPFRAHILQDLVAGDDD